MIETGAIQLRGVKKSFRSFHADSFKDGLIRLARGQQLVDRRAVLRGIDLHVRPGERLGIVGANGAGKSTLFRLISGILVPDAGEIDVGGNVAPLIEITAGLVYDLTGEENIRLSASLLGMGRSDLAKRFDEIVSFAGLENALSMPVRYFSSGMQARLGFSVVAHTDAPIILVDEVLAVGDVDFQARCLAKLRARADAGATVVFVSHDAHAIHDFCHRVVLLDGGLIVKDGTPSDVLGGRHGRD